MDPLAKSLILLLCTTMVIEGNKALFPFPGLPPKTIVQIINNITNPPQKLTLHCKSENDDLGEHTIGVGANYEFRFRPNVIKPVTLYFCSFRWPPDTSLHHYFDIYVQKVDENSCVEGKGGVTLCSWKLWKRGACKYDRHTKAYTNCCPWNRKRGACNDRYSKAYTYCCPWNHPPPAIVASSTVNYTSHV